MSFHSTVLGACCAVQTGPFGSQLHASDYRSTGTPIITVEHLGDNEVLHVALPLVSDEDRRRLSRYLLQAGDVVFSRVGAIDRRAFVSEVEHGWLFSGRLLRVRPNQQQVDGRFLSWLLGLTGAKRWIYNHAVGSTMACLNTSILSAVPIEFPPLPEQRRIAKILDTLDEAIRKTEQVIAKLQQMKQGLLHDLLTRGIDENGELRDPERHPEQFVSIESWVYGRLPGIKLRPRAWQLVQLTEYAKLESGHTPDRTMPSYWDGEVRWLSLHDTKQLEHHTVTETDLRITEAGLQNSSARLLPAGTVALSRTATVGKCVLLGRIMATSQDFACYVCGPLVVNRYLLHLFRFMKPVWRAFSGGSTHQTVYMPVFESLQVLLPPRDEQEAIARRIDSFDEHIATELAEHQKLVLLKQGLMDDLLTGRVRVRVPEEASA